MGYKVDDNCQMHQEGSLGFWTLPITPQICFLCLFHRVRAQEAS